MTKIQSQHSAHDLRTRSTIDLGTLSKRYNNTFPPVDTVYGSSAYQNIRLNTLFTVYVSQSGILVRENELLPDSYINCVTRNSRWKDTIIQLDQQLKVFIDYLF